jgi:hypothetical protein
MVEGVELRTTADTGERTGAVSAPAAATVVRCTACGERYQAFDTGTRVIHCACSPLSGGSGHLVIVRGVVLPVAADVRGEAGCLLVGVAGAWSRWWARLSNVGQAVAVLAAPAAVVFARPGGESCTAWPGSSAMPHPPSPSASP